jgi:hypothetical protein
METVLYNLHCKCCNFALRKTNRWWRCRLEELLLIWSVCGLVALLLAHITFLHIVSKTCLPSIPDISLHDHVDMTTHLILLDDYAGGSRKSFAVNSTSRRQRKEEMACEPWPRSLDDDEVVDDEYWQRGADNACRSSSTAGPTRSPDDDQIYFTYSQHPGWYLRSYQQQRRHRHHQQQHSPDGQQRHSVVDDDDAALVQYVYISKSDVQCFGEPFLQSLVFFLLTPDTVMINWLIGVYGNLGYVYNPRSGKEISLYHPDQHHHYHHHHQRHAASGHDDRRNHNDDYFWWSTYYGDVLRWIGRKISVVAKTTFLFFVTTTLVSFTLRETQGRMLHFTHHLLQHVRSNRPVVQLVVKHVAENVVFVPIMVGIIFFLMEFYRDDKLLAFMVLTLLWICESFSVVRYANVCGGGGCDDEDDDDDAVCCLRRDSLLVVLTRLTIIIHSFLCLATS